MVAPPMMPPPAMGAINPNPMSMPSNPQDLLAALKELVGGTAAPEPVYPSNYKAPKKPDEKGIWTVAKDRQEDFRVLRNRMQNDLGHLRLKLVGCFPEDIEARAQGLQEEYISTALVDEWNLICAFLSGIELGFDKPYLHEDSRSKCQQVEDAVAWLRQEEIIRHGDKTGNVLPMDEARIYTAYGMVVNRTVLDISQPDFPFCSDIIDPATVMPEWGAKTGPRRLWRLYSTTASKLMGQYEGQMTPAAIKELQSRIGKDLTDRTEIEVCEYWDTWYRAVIAEGATIIPTTEHKYGYVPFTIQFSPLGEPMSTASPYYSKMAERTNDPETNAAVARWQDELAFKAVSYIHYRKATHETLEALMARSITGVKKAIDPPLIRYRDELAAEKPMPDFSTAPGEVNEVMMGHEDIKPVPTTPNPLDFNAVMSQLSTDRLTGAAPLAMFGVNDKSNVSGSALGALTDAGMDKVAPWVAGLERYHARRMNQWLLSWRNFGHLAKYAGSTPQPFVIPRRRPRAGESPAFELTQQLIDDVSPRINVKMTRMRKADLLPYLNAAKLGNDLGVLTRRDIAEELGNYDYDRTFEEWAEEQATIQALSDPNFSKLFTVPQAIKEQLQASEGNPEMQQFWMQMLQMWLQMNQPQPQQPPMGQPGPGGPPMGGPGGPPPAPPGSIQIPPGASGPGPIMNPNTSAGVSFPALGQGPGSVTGIPGGPR